MTKVCSHCRKEKSADQFHRRTEATRVGELRPYCKACHLERGRRWRAANKERDKRSGRNLHLKRTFGITVADEDAMIAACGNRCQICGEPPLGKRTSTQRLHVDHDAETGEIRGLLCSKCNQGIGMFNHQTRRLAAAIEYLRAAYERRRAIA